MLMVSHQLLTRDTADTGLNPYFDCFQYIRLLFYSLAIMLLVVAVLLTDVCTVGSNGGPLNVHV